MVEREFVKIENKEMPKDKFKYLKEENKSQAGFTNLIFLAGGVVTAFMWGILMFLGR